jgi:hypothetical protein
LHDLHTAKATADTELAATTATTESALTATATAESTLTTTLLTTDLATTLLTTTRTTTSGCEGVHISDTAEVRNQRESNESAIRRNNGSCR